MQDSDDTRRDQSDKGKGLAGGQNRRAPDDWQHAEDQHEETEREVSDELARNAPKKDQA